MSKKPLNIGEEVAVQMPMKTVASLIIIVALGTMGYFQIIERLNVADTRIQIMEKDLEENKINKHVEDMALNKVNIQFLRTQMDKVLEDIEKLKDANREIGYKNGSYSQ
jgi:Tfp pilus assembly protein PilO